jgi:hypothetical protein
MYFDTSLKTSRETVPEYPVRPFKFVYYESIKRGLKKRLISEYRCDERLREDTKDTTRLVEIEELKCAVRVLLFVTKLSPVDAHKDKAAGWGATL